ncbi:DUF2148 domain-containing protein [Methanohalophilus sp.]|uniref:ferredoxin domain-containing protein n=1 Tax=Methanohalophilus sp. TaxID=1966352 RepID=UPI0026321167|nr:DUF2148 domain-containing protein [Methanohalophilus sp.]MDK2892059.1 hypothetical protein [Methanohalophilus sp.]
MLFNHEKHDIETMAALILTAARTAPKTKGIDDIVTAFAEAEDREKIAAKMEELADLKGEKFAFLKRDAGNVRQADALLLIGVKSSGVEGLNCGACGHAECNEMLKQNKLYHDYDGPICAFKHIDLGIALGAAAAKAKDLCIDSRMMYSAGMATKQAGLIDADVAIGMPLSISGKNPFFDRK